MLLDLFRRSSSTKAPGGAQPAADAAVRSATWTCSSNGQQPLFETAQQDGLQSRENSAESSPEQFSMPAPATSSAAPASFRDTQHAAQSAWRNTEEPARAPPLPAADPFAGHPYYRPVRLLNRGASGFVALARDVRTGEQYAVKFVQRGESFDMKTISRELMNQRMCAAHPNIIQLQEAFLTPTHLGIAMEYADGGDLSQYIDDLGQKGVDGLPEEDARWLFQQLVVALDYCHRLGIANRDVKLDNMMMHGSWPSPVLKMCDFGYSKDEAGQSISKSTCGTPEYMAPEVLFERVYDGRSADIWSCGVSLYVLLTGGFPFAGDDDDEVGAVVRMQKMFSRIITCECKPLTNVSDECRDLMHQLLRPDPNKRATMAQLYEHPWFRRHLPPQLLTLNSRILAASAHGAGLACGTQSATEVLALVSQASSSRSMRSASASPGEYDQYAASPQAALSRATSQPMEGPEGPRQTPPRLRASAPAPPRRAPRSSFSDHSWPQASPLPQRRAAPPPPPPPQLQPAPGLWPSRSQTERRLASHVEDMETDAAPATTARALAPPQMPLAGRFSRISL